MNRLISDPTVDPAALEQMRRLGGAWAAYQNHDMGHPDLGHLTFLAFGPGRTFATPPARYPDTPAVGLGWRYLLVGRVNLATGVIEADDTMVQLI